MTTIQKMVTELQFQLPDSGLVATKLARAKIDYNRSKDAAKDYRRHLVKSYGVDIKFEQAASGIARATTKYSWWENRPYHRVILHPPFDPLHVPHLSAHELTHIELASEAHRKTGRYPRFCVPLTVQVDEGQNAPPTAVLASEVNLDTLTQEDQWKLKLLHPAFNRIMDMVVEKKVIDNRLLKALSAAQFISLETEMRECVEQHNGFLKFAASAPPSALPPHHLVKASLAVGCAYALFLDRLFGNVTSYFPNPPTTQESCNVRKLAEEICDYCQSQIPILEPAGEIKLVDQVMDMLDLTGLYEWA